MCYLTSAHTPIEKLFRAAFDERTLSCAVLCAGHGDRRGKGRLVVVSSMAAKVPSPGQAVYSAAKMAVWGYFASLATELADK